MKPGIDHCRFRSSRGGTTYCSDAVYSDGLCRFHYECLQRGELLPNGQINELLFDQDRRRTINFHSIPEDDGYFSAD